MTAKRKDGKEYEPGSLTSFQNTLQRILVDRGSKINIKTDTEFEKSPKVLASKRKELTSNGYGNHPNAARVLEQEEIDELYKKVSLAPRLLLLYKEHSGGSLRCILVAGHEMKPRK